MGDNNMNDNSLLSIDELDSIAGGRVSVNTDMEMLLANGININQAHKNELRKKLLAGNVALRAEDLENVTGGVMTYDNTILEDWPEEI